MEVLILSALGCGAFGNPPEHMAFIFQEVLEEFAGAFKKIYFAIKGGRNLDVFRQVLTGKKRVVKLPPKVMTRKPIIAPEVAFEMLSGPGKDADEQKPICSFGGNCRDVWMQGCSDSPCSQLFHPAICECGKTPASKFDRWHLELFTHPKPCFHGNLCAQKENPLHMLVATHNSDSCPEGARCSNRTEAHERQFKHPPLCEKMRMGTIIPDACLESKEHMQVFWHPDPVRCCHETVCFQWMDMRHLAVHHPLADPKKGKEKVKLMCRYMHCRDKHKADHVLASLHVHLPECPDERCDSKDPDHLDSLSHEGTGRQWHKQCRDGRRCRNLELKHHQDYRHEAIHLKHILCPAYPLRPFYKFIDFAGNLEVWLSVNYVVSVPRYARFCTRKSPQKPLQPQWLAWCYCKGV